MASEDVIELGSSDDEPEPTPNKKKKPFPNAMVHIPNKLHGVTIRPASIKKNNLGEPATMVKVPNAVTAVKNKPNGKSVLTVKKSNLIQNPVKVQKSSINPISLMKKLSNSQVMINKVPANVLKNPIRIQSPRMSYNPAPITITKVYGNLKRVNNVDVSHTNTKKRKVVNNTTGGVLTVNLDDDDVSTSSASGPQWYLRPEEQDQSNLEELNNKEPKPNNFIEITIEDSPVKPLQNKNNDEGNDESAILVDDSPLKTVATKINSISSDSDQKTRKKQSHSKKRLEYPKETENTVSKEAIEIEIEPVEVESSCKDVPNEDNMEENKDEVHIVEIVDSPVKKVQSLKLNMSKKDNDSKNTHAGAFIENENSEFDLVYQNFIDLCFRLENSDDMKKIVEKKIKAYYRQVPKEYIKSEEFIEMVSSKTTAMKADPGKMYLYIKDIVDELNLQRKMVKLNDPVVENHDAETECVKDGEFDVKRHRQIRKLEKTIKKLHRAIQKLEEQEVDFDDEEDSVYLLTERYKERMVRVHAKLCQLTYTKMPSEARVHIEARPGRPTGPAKRLEKWVNKKLPIGTPLPFPDFHDVLRCVREANEEDNLGWNEVDIMEEAQDLFTRCGKKLQRRRQENEWRLAVSRISSDIDPAESSEELRRKLEQNKQMATIRETEILNKYADRQKQLKLEPEEIGDKEAEESPIESEDDEINDNDSSLESKFKRKERLKRLIQEKSRINTFKSKTEESKIQNKDTGDVTENVSCGSKAEENLQKENLQTDVTNVETEVVDVNDEKQQCSENKERTNSISEDSNKIESDIDELHLLNKLYSENEINTSQDSTGSITPIAISDTLDSSSDIEQKEKRSSDVISIENSSYSESETINDSRHNEDLNLIHESIKTTNDGVQVECTGTNVLKLKKINNQEYVENILLASSCDEESNGAILENNSEFVNLRDDNISVGETLVQEDDHKKGNANDDENNGNLNDNCDLKNKDSGRNSDKTVILKNIPQSMDLSDSEKTLVAYANTMESMNDFSVKKIENTNNIQAESSSEVSSQNNTKRSSEEFSKEHSENKEKTIKGKVDVNESVQNDKKLRLGGDTSEMEIDMNDSGKVEKITNKETNVIEVDNNQPDQTLEQLLDEMMGTDSNDLP